MNTTAKGNRNQLKARRRLEAEGWQVVVAKRSSRWDAEIDFWGLFDLIAYKRPGYIKLIQVKSNICPNEVREKLRAFETDGWIVRKELWIYKDYSKMNPHIERW